MPLGERGAVGIQARTECWSASSPQAFLLRRPALAVTGPDPGIVYIMRSDAHGLDMHKIGSRGAPPSRGRRELSSATGVPLPFGILRNGRSVIVPPSRRRSISGWLHTA